MRRFLILLLLFHSYTLPLSAIAQSPDPVIVAAGDIVCQTTTSTSTTCHQQQTSDLALSLNPTAVLTTGDNQYESGSLSQYQTYYAPTWGRLDSIVYPVPGNHEYNTAGAAGYFSYFQSRFNVLDPQSRGYYSYDLGSWHLIALNSQISVGAGSAQEQWLRADLAAHPTSCTLAYWHHPRFSSGTVHGNNTSMQPLWQALYDAQADLVLNGHEHNYERFAPQSPVGIADSNGIREFVAGMGGKDFHSFGAPITNSQFRNNTSFGVLKLVLHPQSYDWQFISDTNQIIDSGTSPCVGVVTTPTPTSTPSLRGLLQAWSTNNPTYDLNSDGKVNAFDFAKFVLSSFGL